MAHDLPFGCLDRAVRTLHELLGDDVKLGCGQCGPVLGTLCDARRARRLLVGKAHHDHRRERDVCGDVKPHVLVCDEVGRPGAHLADVIRAGHEGLRQRHATGLVGGEAAQRDVIGIPALLRDGLPVGVQHLEGKAGERCRLA